LYRPTFSILLYVHPNAREYHNGERTTKEGPQPNPQILDKAESLQNGKHSSLFCRCLKGDEKVHNIDDQVYFHVMKCFFFVTDGGGN
jgi:hypothetical protein